jgi:hypothetical protein
MSGGQPTFSTVNAARSPFAGDIHSATTFMPGSPALRNFFGAIIAIKKSGGQLPVFTQIVNFLV